MEILENQLSRLRNAEKLSTAASGALEVIADGESCATDQIGSAVKALEDALNLDESLETVLEPLRTAFYSLQDGTHELRAYAEGVQSDPVKLEETAERIDTLRKLRRKYGDDEAKVLECLENARRDLDLLTDVEGNETEISAQLVQGETVLKNTCGDLTQMRQDRAKEFSALVQGQLRDLAMDRAVFETKFEPKPVDATGADQVEFFFSANAGEPARPLAKIASGGEISRVMLGIKSAMAGLATVPTLVFDEVDVGLGGRAAAVVARKLEQLARHSQVLVISHLPQIAGRATSHYRIEKSELSGRVRTVVRSLSGDERVDEIGRMLSGDELSESARSAARELLTGS